MIFRLLLVSVIFLPSIYTANSQNEEAVIAPCHSTERMDELFKKHPQYKALYEKSHQHRMKMLEENLDDFSSDSRGVVYTIPVVFHVLHAGGIENISNEQIFDALSILNRDFRKLNSDVNNVNPVFAPIAADIEVEFVMATIAPDGTCFNGITRTFTTLTHNGSDGQMQVNAVVSGNDVYQGNWRGDRYLNIYVCNNIGGAAGYTFFPWGNGQHMFYDGIFMLQSYTGSIGTSNVSRSRTLTHEVGHWLDLPHLWGYTNSPNDPSNCFDDDDVADTPNTVGWQSCNTNGLTCDGINKPLGTIDNVENYMEYAYCAKMFTEGQKSRMRNTLVNSQGRNNIWTNSNLTLVGANGNQVLCRADFKSDRRTVCEGGSIQFSDQSFHNVTNWSWTFPGGTPAISNAQNPTVAYNNPGNYAVTLEASDGTGTVTETRASYITVLPNSGRTAPFFEGFESVNMLPNTDWYLVNNYGGSFEVTSLAAASGSKSLYINNNIHVSGEIDEFVSTTIDLTAAISVNLSFKYAFAKKDNSNTDVIQVWASADCGQTWALRKNISAFQIPTAPNTFGNYVPSPNDWVTVDITNITSQFYTPNFQFKIFFKSGGGNNLFIDDINLDVSTQLTDSELISDLIIYPNPTSNTAFVEFLLQSAADVKVEILDMLGRKVQDISSAYRNAGQQKIEINKNHLSHGMYFVRLQINSEQVVRKITFE
ncbi:MAG: M43 family zinc metalloprotease [Flavobacteriales bacterium]